MGKEKGTDEKLMAGPPLLMGAGAHCWEQGSSPRQSRGGNDCGIWMLMIWLRFFARVTYNEDFEAASGRLERVVDEN